ncbi:MAG: hypothetical protein ACFFE2_12075 [Candidatus Thorarchaeota archaeon]
MGSITEDEQDMEFQLTGRTLKVYWFLLKERKPVDRKVVQKGTGLSAPSLAEYHLRKLMDLGLVDKLAHGDYVVTKTVRVGITRFYFKFRNSLVPRFALYSSFYLILLTYTVIILNRVTNDVAFLFLSILLFGVVTSLFELMTLIRSSP